MQGRFNLHNYPLVKIVLPFIVGIIIAFQFNIGFKITLVALICVTLIFIVFNYQKQWQLKQYWLLIIPVLCLLFGMSYTSLFIYKNQTKHFSKYNSSYVVGFIKSGLLEKEKSYRTIINVTSAIDSLQNNYICNGNLLLYIAKDSTTEQYSIGDKVLIKCRINEVEAPKNPYQFNYKQYLLYSEIYNQAYVKPWQIKLLATQQKYSLLRKSNEVSIKIQLILKKYIVNKKYFQLADGILLGHKSDLDAATYEAFALSGLMHILSVSGLHVGIIYMLLSFLFSFLPKRKKGAKWIKFIGVAIGIWLFAFIVGLTPAVVRAALLFSLLNFGKLNNERSTSLNLLAGACFIQLLFNPLLVYNIGFQLSYLAMLGIFLMYQPINSLFYSKYKAINWIWQLWSLSLSAQLFTLPLSIYYFGNFPTYFLLANIFAIPLATLILWLSVVLIPASLIPSVAIFVGKVTSFLIAVLIKSTALLVELPLGKIQNIYIDKFQLIVIFIGIIFFIYGFIYRKNKSIISAMCIFILCIFFSYWHTYKNLNKNELKIYSISNNLCIGIHYKDTATILFKDSISNKQFGFNIANHHKHDRIKTIQYIPLNDSTKVTTELFKVTNNLMLFRDNYFYILNKHNISWKFKKKLLVNYLILTDNLFLNIKQLQENYQFQKIIISSDNDFYHTKIYKQLLEENNISYIDINKKYFRIE